MSFMMALLLAVVMGLLLTENLGYGHIQISRPVFAGPIIGLLMGDLETGLIVGGTVEMMFMGVIPRWELRWPIPSACSRSLCSCWIIT